MSFSDGYYFAVLMLAYAAKVKGRAKA